MNHPILRYLTLIAFALTPAGLSAQSGFGAVTYGSDDCNNDPEYLTNNNISCTAIFSDTNVWDFLNNLPRRITLETLVELNPRLGEVDYNSVLGGITFVRVQ